ncbi:diaminohydroxyphosphoribosylaminopyrimidine deaminase/5-amino-6-(5-phosphoribosylamino)uracil reductase [Georgenia soli]|uniref:Riboflavin biosynthesis protein RibD n=1 Tax=Georgenia soli TaxID=638953 RepID=A0A2A9EGG0_9MICO|nr:bifunctional diaminohydroxyphosphoribosylaminopyrimidine deaminase/5-amino-6-(5-phosphoribosylamino)uracil reductase RibD [Georgenia soli]PFG38014.1 diaminohydroxyphosphoribosylaminopyrimidine deaminase/5-amino-6-(5-phosphoribosylamino)uracil reductase [Georgenia soli]
MSTITTTRAATESAALDRATDLAARGPQAGGNPRVGCVLLGARGEVLAEGYHRGAGTAHAEADALSRVDPARRGKLVGGTAVVTLEPCHHTGRTPPCSRALHAAGIARVVTATPDPDTRATGGSSWLRDQGVEVLTARAAGVDPAVVARAEALTHTWRTAVRRSRPWLVAKTATTLDGRVAAADGTSRWITSAESREHAHALRADVDAILVGTGTVLADDPALTARPGGPHTGAGRPAAAPQPLRVVVGERPVPQDARVRHGAGEWVHLATRDLGAVLEELHRRGVRHALLEGGPTLLTAALGAGLVDELHAYVAPVLLGTGAGAVGDLGVRTIADALRWRTVSTLRLGEDLFLAARPQTHPDDRDHPNDRDNPDDPVHPLEEGES